MPKPVSNLVSTPIAKSAASREEAISWLLHTIKILLGYQDIRRDIIIHYFPNLKYNEKKYMRTFDAFINRKTRQDKYDIITRYFNEIEALDKKQKLKKDETPNKNIVIFTATNIQQDVDDNETHYQTFIVDKDNKKVYAIDPALDKKKKDFIGIYYPEIARDLVKPFFEGKGYTVQFIQLSKPAQTTTDDVFCQSWSLLILLQMLIDDRYENNEEFKIPASKPDKYEMLLNFYKKIFTENPTLKQNLKLEYEITIKGLFALEEEENGLLYYDPYELLQTMTKTDMRG